MNPCIYYSATLILYAAEIYMAIAVSDIGDVFGFIGTIAGTSLSFFIPSIMFCFAFTKFANASYKQRFGNLNLISITNGVIGIAFFALFLYANILSLEN